MLTTLIILILAAMFFVNGKIRSDVVALCALVALLVAHILTPEEALSGFSNNVVIMMVGLFVVGGAIVQTGLAKMISARILKLAGKSELRLFILIILVTAAIGAFVSNTGTVALMLPIVVSMAANAGVNASRLPHSSVRPPTSSSRTRSPKPATPPSRSSPSCPWASSASSSDWPSSCP